MKVIFTLLSDLHGTKRDDLRRFASLDTLLSRWTFRQFGDDVGDFHDQLQFDFAEFVSDGGGGTHRLEQSVQTRETFVDLRNDLKRERERCTEESC